MKDKKLLISIVLNALIICATIALFIIYIFVTDYTTQTYLTNFRFFTQESNLFVAITSAIMLGFEIYKLKHPDYIIPKWITIIRYISVTAVCLAFLFTLFGAFIILFSGGGFTWKWFFGYNFIAHVFNPFTSLICFGLFEKDHKIKFPLMLIGISTSFIYSIVYLICVVFIGCWNDHYSLIIGGQMWTIPFSMIGMYLIQFIICIVTTKLHNKDEINKNSASSI